MSELNFCTESLRILDSLAIPAIIVREDQLIYANRKIEEIGPPWRKTVIEEAFHLERGNYFQEIQLKCAGYNVRITGAEGREYLFIRINTNGMPSSLVLTDFSSKGVCFEDCINFINSSKGIEKILVVDDEQVIIDTYSSILEVLGYSTILYSKPLDAVNDMKELDFDLIITDYNMPDMNGLELAQYVKSIKPAIPVIICSGLIDCYMDKLRTLDCGQPVVFLGKPLGLKKLTETIKIVDLFRRICLFFNEEKIR